MGESKPRKGRSIIRALDETEKLISEAIDKKKEFNIEKLYDLATDFKFRVQEIIGPDENLGKILEIFNDRYFFPRVQDISNYIDQRFSAKIGNSKSRSYAAWRASRIIVERSNLEGLKSDVKTLRESQPRPSKPSKVNIHMMEIEEIRREFNDEVKYPEVEAIKKALKGIIASKRMSKIQSRETLVELVIDEARRARSVQVFSKGQK